MSTDGYAEPVPAVASERALAAQREHLQRAEGYRAQIPPRRLAEIDAERLAKVREGR